MDRVRDKLQLVSSIDEIIRKDAITAAAKKDEHASKTKKACAKIRKTLSRGWIHCWCQYSRIHFQPEHYKGVYCLYPFGGT